MRYFNLLLVIYMSLTGCGEGGDIAIAGNEAIEPDIGFETSIEVEGPFDSVSDENNWLELEAETGLDVETDRIEDTGVETSHPEVQIDNLVPCVEGKVCDDGDPCTHSDICKDGVCKGKPYTCDDKRECTDNICDGYGGCRYPVSEGRCLINGVCYQAGEASLLSPCVVCDPTNSKTEFSLAKDGTPCGTEKSCVAFGVCNHGQCDAGPIDCDDDNPCTDDKCIIGTGCVHIPNFDPCEDGDPCTLGDQCQNGKCVTGFLPLDCFDDNPCTADICTPEGCDHPPMPGQCDDGDNCTEGDMCVDGECVSGPPLDCDDMNDCTEDWCDQKLGCRHSLISSPCCTGGFNICDDKNPCTKDICNLADGSCSHDPWFGPCNDGNACTGPDICSEDGICSGPLKDCDDKNPCTSDSCDPKVGCKYTPIQAVCDDNNLCTIDDVCLPNGVCSGKPLSCDDKNPCTKDICDPKLGCQHEVLTGPCNDYNACTTSDTCVLGVCVGQPVNCDDKNQCTADSCHPSLGCQYQQIYGPCDDGNPCTVDDHCENGVCKGTPQGLCCTPVFDAPVNRINKLELGNGGQPGEALDVDGKASTCAPPDNCSNGLDNSLGALAGVANPELAKAFAKGDLNILFEHRGFNTNGTPYMLAFWSGKKVDDACDNTTQSCAYLVESQMMDQNCNPLYGFKNAKVQGTKLTAGGVGYNWPLDIPVAPGVTLHVLVANTQLVATLTLSQGKPVAMKGVLGGAIPKKAMIDAVNALPEEGLPISKQAIIDLITAFVVNDIDTDGDGNLDAVSIGLKFEAIGGTIVGVKSP